MASVSFSIKGNKDLSSIYVRFKANKAFDCQKRFGNYMINKKHWDIKKKKFTIKNNPDLNIINIKMNEFEKFILNQYTSYSIDENSQYFKEWFNLQLDIFFEKNIEVKKNKFTFFSEFINFFIENINIFKNEKNEIYSKTFISQFKNILLKLKEFEKEFYKVKINKVDIEFRNDFVGFLYDYYDFEDSTVDKYIKNIKLICKHATQFETGISEEYKTREFKRTKYETNETYLNEEEINKISDIDLKGEYILNQIRDCFIIFLWTGIRFSDYKNLSIKNITTDTFNNKYITILTNKTKKKITIPLHKNVVKIIEQYNNDFPTSIHNSLYNKSIKKICEKANIVDPTEGKIKMINEEGVLRNVKGIFPKYKLIKAHTTRRSFATNMFLKGIPTYNIMQITGHTTETNFFKYIRLTNRESASMIHEIWNQ